MRRENGLVIREPGLGLFVVGRLPKVAFLIGVFKRKIGGNRARLTAFRYLIFETSFPSGWRMSTPVLSYLVDLDRQTVREVWASALVILGDGIARRQCKLARLAEDEHLGRRWTPNFGIDRVDFGAE